MDAAAEGTAAVNETPAAAEAGVPASQAAQAGAAEGSGPRRVLVISAPVGEGHVAAARTIAARARAVWPGAEVVELEHAGRGGEARDRFLRGTYALVMRFLPGAYGVGYDMLVRRPRFAELCKRVAAARLGRALAPAVEQVGPDLVFSTYPMLSGGLAWLRRRGRLPGRGIAVVTDVAVHPFWMWPDLDETWTLLPASRDQALRIGPLADVRVAAPAVDPRFRPGDRDVARRELGLSGSAFLVLVTGGSLGFGSLPAVVEAVLAAGPQVEAVVLCGRNERLRARLRRHVGSRLTALGWTDRVPEYVTAADVVLTTAGGMIATEALAAGRPVVFAAPVPGHGRASAELTAAAGLALVCPEPADVTRALRTLAGDVTTWTELAARARDFGGRELDAELAALARRCRPAGAGSDRRAAGTGGESVG